MVKKALLIFFLLVSTAYAQFGGNGPLPANLVVKDDGVVISGNGRKIDLRTGLSATFDSITGTYHLAGSASGVNWSDPLNSIYTGWTNDASGNVTLGSSGHIISTGTAPTIANNDCGSTAQGTVNTYSTDLKGAVTAGTLAVTSCAMTFNTAFGTAPFCIAQDDTNILGVKVSATTTKMTITATTSMSGDTINYHCIQ